MSPWPGLGRRLWWLALAAPLLAGLDRAPLTPLGQGPRLLDDQLVQTFFLLRGPRPAPADPVILAIDADSLELGELLAPGERQASPLWRQMGPWPWPRALQARLAAHVLEQGAARVLFNIEYSQPSRFGPADDRAFVATLNPWRQRVHLAAHFGVREEGGVQESRLRLPIHPLGAPGLTTLLQSPRGVVEAVPGQGWIEARLGDFPPPLPRPMAFLVRPAPPPPAPMGLNFPGPAGTMPRVPAWKLLEAPPSTWRGRTVLIGVTAPGLGDLQETPFGPMAGTEIQAVAVANVLQGRGLGRLPPAGDGLLLLGWGALAGLLLRRPASAGGTLQLALALAGGVLLAGGAAWAGAQLRLPLAALLLAPVAGGGVRAVGQGLAESRERAYLHQVLSRRVSPTLLRDILRSPGPLWNQAVGRRARCAVLFSDLVGFTPLSAVLEPAELFALLNRYFEAMAAAVLEQEGLLDKFIGDAVMAEFGVPRSRGDAEEARAAVRAALAMQQRLEALNVELAAAGTPPLKHGIGLHFGEVIAGNLGSSQRLEFTVVGASVNVTSRLEGLTRLFPAHPILVSGDLLALLPEELEVLPLGSHRIKGWPVPLEVYALQGLRPAGAAPG
ncbi:adenylate/guanylate cyclase domain-containing protein [Cyanobium sp. Candia 9D4]|uniref:adenylate/guanylate cyclase domain-containing protein n=1 Tax=Cyanobium sp. Candia 9D4 TaxID=2823707 RepID=UPI0020CBB8CD|nr:adenylate/guanylate cyclase domain-containing protein [Cyanobium sp. Candia 9D4]MCP9933697.1 adenylate/guanylate cyclase domain-containing protein [Cyanobium sp. Candia 9D4]